MKQLPTIGSILQVKGDFDKDKFWHSFKADQLVIRVPGTMPGDATEGQTGINCMSLLGSTQWLIDGCFTVVHFETEAMPWDANTPPSKPVAHLKQFMVNNEIDLGDPVPLPPVPTSSGPVDILNSSPRTQKGRGLKVLVHLGHILPKTAFLYRKPIESSTFWPTISGKVMARPCPSRPRHGFVDSRVVKNVDDLNIVINETLAHDPHGEVVCMPYIPAAYSGMVTNTSVSVGKGTDGATAGTSAIQFPCVTNLDYTFSLTGRMIHCINGRRRARPVYCSRYITHNESRNRLFVETVGDKVVQLRTGPNTDHGFESSYSWSQVDCVRPDTVYTVTGEEDFLAYENLLDDFKKKSTRVIVYFPTGSLLSHFAVQAIAKGVPVVTGKAAKVPKVGMLYHFPIHDSHVPFGLQYRKAVLNGIKVAASMPVATDTLTWAVSIIQGVGAAKKVIPSVALLTAATMILMRAGTGICLGEYRHFYRKGPGLSRHQPMGPLGIPLNYTFSKGEYATCRDDVYKEVFTSYDWASMETYYKMHQYLTAIEYDFRHRPWRASYGGPKWGDCTAAVLQVFNAMLPMMRMTKTYPSSSLNSHSPMFGMELLNQLIAASNRLITVSHNSNKCLTKLISSDTLSNISHGQTGLAIACSPYTMKVIK